MYKGMDTMEVHAIDLFRQGVTFVKQFQPTPDRPVSYWLTQAIGDRFSARGMSILDAVIQLDERVLFDGQHEPPGVTASLTVADVRYGRREARITAQLFKDSKDIGYASITVSYSPDAIIARKQDICP